MEHEFPAEAGITEAEDVETIDILMPYLGGYYEEDWPQILRNHDLIN